MSDVKGDKPRRAGYDTLVMAKEGGLIRGGGMSQRGLGKAYKNGARA